MEVKLAETTSEEALTIASACVLFGVPPTRRTADALMELGIELHNAIDRAEDVA